MRRLLPRVAAGSGWQDAARSLFGGQGSFGNRSAMRVAPLGAYFADDLELVVEHARRSAAVTHAHPEAAAGAIAVAVAVASAWRLRDASPSPTLEEFFDQIVPWVPDSAVLARIRRARTLPRGTPVEAAVEYLGNGGRVTAQDTVPFALWCASQHVHDYEEALWLTVSGLGDRDTTCAIVGAIVAPCTGIGGIPEEWRRSREPLPEWGLAV